MAHGVVEGQTQNLDKEVNGVAGQIALGPTPVAVFDQSRCIGISGQLEVVGGPLDEL